MFAATADQLAERVRQDFWWLRAGRWLIDPERDQERRRRLWIWIMAPVAFVGAVLYAQALPYLLDRALPPLLAQLPWVNDRELLGRIETVFTICHELLRDLGKYSHARKKAAHWLEELDEQLDMLEFVRTNGDDLDATIAQIRAQHVEHDTA